MDLCISVYILEVLMAVLIIVLQKTFTKHHSWNICFQQRYSLSYSHSRIPNLGKMCGFFL